MKFPVIPVSSGLIIQNNKVLIGLRSENDNGGGLWEFPGGKIEIDESSENAVIRELSEELDIIVRKPKKIMQYLHRFKNLIYDISFFEVISFKGSIKKIVHDELEWVDLDSIKNYNFISGDLLIIDRLINEPNLVKGLE
jgi:mutator protein MutT